MINITCILHQILPILLNTFSSQNKSKLFAMFIFLKKEKKECILIFFENKIQFYVNQI